MGNPQKEEIIYKKIETEQEIAGAKRLIVEYIRWLNQDLSFQNIDDELSSFPRKYSEPEGSFIVAVDGNTVVGCVGIKNLGNRACEMKRLFVADDYKGRGIGKQLVAKMIEEAEQKQYACIRLDTLNTMETALKIYADSGFVEIEPYYNNPHDKVVYMEKVL